MYMKRLILLKGLILEKNKEIFSRTNSSYANITRNCVCTCTVVFVRRWEDDGGKRDEEELKVWGRQKCDWITYAVSGSGRSAGGKQAYPGGSYMGESNNNSRARFTVQLPEGRREKSGVDRRRDY